MGLKIKKGNGKGFAYFFIGGRLNVCARAYPRNYIINGISRPGYFGFDVGGNTPDGRINRITNAWVPYTINNFVVSNGTISNEFGGLGCLNLNQLTWSQFDALSGAQLKLYYLNKNNGWAGGYDIPDGSWVIYKDSAYVFETIAYAVGSRWSPPRYGYTFRNGYEGYVTLKYYTMPYF